MTNWHVCRVSSDLLCYHGPQSWPDRLRQHVLRHVPTYCRGGVAAVTPDTRELPGWLQCVSCSCWRRVGNPTLRVWDNVTFFSGAVEDGLKLLDTSRARLRARCGLLLTAMNDNNETVDLSQLDPVFEEQRVAEVFGDALSLAELCFLTLFERLAESRGSVVIAEEVWGAHDLHVLPGEVNQQGVSNRMPNILAERKIQAVQTLEGSSGDHKHSEPCDLITRERLCSHALSGSPEFIRKCEHHLIVCPVPFLGSLRGD